MRILHLISTVAITLLSILLPGAGTVSVRTANPIRVTLNAPHVGDQLLVKLSAGGRSRLLASGATILSEIPALDLALIEVPTDEDLAHAAMRLDEDAGIEWAEPNYTISLDFVPDDPLYQSVQAPYLSRLSAGLAWDYTLGRPDTVIAVLDTGVDMQHEDLAGGIWTNPREIADNGADDDANGFIDDLHGWDFAQNDNTPDDDHGHGTHVAGIAAARIGNGKGIAGMAGRAKIMPVDVFDYGIGTYESLIRAIVYATDNGARVINMSLGATSYSRGEEAAVDYAYEHGVVLVAAAGNAGRDEVHYPAAHAHVIAVASTTAADGLSYFSTRGDWVDVAAPGSSIYSTYRGNSYATLSGTSMATPHVSGLAALILSRDLNLAPDVVRALIEGTADDLGPAGRDIYYGMGRINAGRALALTPSAPPLDVDVRGCTELLANGGFEAGTGEWQASGAVEVVSNLASNGQNSLYFAAGPNALGMITQTVSVDPKAFAGVLRFDYRIDPTDNGHGSPNWPFDDWFTAEWRGAAGEPLGRLLLTGNTADTVNSGLPWDRYLYRLDAIDLAQLTAAGAVSLVFTSQNDSDDSPTKVWLDAVSFCTTTVLMPSRQFLPIVMEP